MNYAKISFLVTRPFLPLPDILSNSDPLIPSFCAIERTKGEKNLFESAALGIEVVSIVSSIDRPLVVFFW